MSHSRASGGLAAAAATGASVLSLVERDWLRGGTGLVIAATFALIVSGLPERSATGKWILYTLLGIVFILLAIKFFSRFFISGT